MSALSTWNDAVTALDTLIATDNESNWNAAVAALGTADAAVLAVADASGAGSGVRNQIKIDASNALNRALGQLAFNGRSTDFARTAAASYRRQSASQARAVLVGIPGLRIKAKLTALGI